MFASWSRHFENGAVHSITRHCSLYNFNCIAFSKGIPHLGDIISSKNVTFLVFCNEAIIWPERIYHYIWFFGVFQKISIVLIKWEPIWFYKILIVVGTYLILMQRKLSEVAWVLTKGQVRFFVTWVHLFRSIHFKTEGILRNSSYRFKMLNVWQSILDAWCKT